MKILFLGYAVSEEEAKKLSGVSIAGNKMQLNILKNLEKNIDKLYSITVYPIAVYPRDKRILVKDKRINIGNNIYSQVTAFLNIPFVKQISQVLSVYYAARTIIKESPDTKIFTFNMYPQVGTPAKWLKRKYGCQVISLLADLPIDDNYQRKGISKILRKIFDEQTKKNILEADQVIVLNQHARDIFAPKTPYLIVDGGINLEEFGCNEKKRHDKCQKNIVYGGSLAEYSGVKQLVDCMEFVSDESIVLDIYGKGALAEYIREKTSTRIRYHGTVTNQEMLEVQKGAWLLVNPRPVEDLIAKVTFPSKIFEYMMSGTPVLTTKLNGFTSSYEGKVFFAENNSPKKLAESINLINNFSETELKKMAESAREFLIKEKTWDKQVEKIVTFIEKVDKE